MRRIGSFTRNGDHIFEGQITTLAVKLEVRELIPNAEAEDGSSRAPDLLAFSGAAEIGAAWAKPQGEWPTPLLHDPPRRPQLARADERGAVLRTGSIQ